MPTTMTTHELSAAARAAIAKRQASTAITGETMDGGQSAAVMIASLVQTRATSSRITSVCLADLNGRSFATAIANTPCAALNRGRSRPSEPSA